MREIIFKHLTSNDCRDHQVSVMEAVEEDGMLAKSMRASHYVLKGRVAIDSARKKQQINDYFTQQPPEIKTLSIVKQHNSQHAEDCYSYKAVGRFYLLTGEEVLLFDFIEWFQIKLTDLKKIRDTHRH